MFGVHNFTAIINPPQAAILSVGALQASLIPSDDQQGELKKVTTTTATLSCDARVIQTELACQWLNTFSRIVEQPTAQGLL